MILIKIPFPGNGQFFANKKVTCAKLSRTPCLSFAEPMLGNNASYEDSFITCQITPNDHGSLPDSLACLQFGIPSQDNLLLTSSFFSRFTGPPKKITLTSASSFVELLRNFRENIPFRKPEPSALSWNLVFGNSAVAFGIYLLGIQKPTFGSTSGKCKDGGGSPLQVIYSRPLADRIIILGFCLANICEF